MLSGCTLTFRQWMYDQPKAKNYNANEFFADGRDARPLVPGTVAVSDEYASDVFTTGMQNGEYVTDLPMELTPELLEQGQLQYNVYCSPCHGMTGYGNGMIARRGGTPPTNYHTDYLRNQPVGYLFSVMTNGFRNMWSYEQKIPPEDRWAIAAYIRALQLSQNANADQMPPEVLNNPQGGAE
jgi:mono/diheme cytochrome c family protein